MEVEEASGSPKPSDLVDQMLELQDKYDKLRSEKERAEREFGIQRAKLKDLFLSRESELKKEQGTSKKMKEEAIRLKAELENFRKAAEFSQKEMEQEIQSLRKTSQEEGASIQRIMQEAVEEAKQLSSQQYEAEHQLLVKKNQELESQLRELQSGQPGVDGILTSLSHILKKPSPPGISPNDQKKEQPARSLEDSMAKAQEDAEVLRSIVMPLEQEICSLKAKLRDSQEKVKLLEIQAKASSAADADKFQITTEDQAKDLSTEELRDKVNELQHYLESERSSRTDLEMYVAVLNTQKGVLQEDADKLRKELHNVCRLLEQEKQAHRELKETWQQVYEQFLDAQDAQTAELEQIKKVLTADQIELLKHEGVFESPKTAKPDLPRPSSAEPAVGQLILISPSDNASSSIEGNTERSLLDSSNPSLTSLDTSALSNIMSVQCTNTPQASYNVSQELTDVFLSSKKVNMRRVQSLNEITEAEKGLTDDGRTQSDNDLTSHGKVEGNLDITDKLVSLSAHSRNEWTALNEKEITFPSQEQLSTEGCVMCTNYEQQLQKVQKEKQALQELAAKLQNSVDKDQKIKEELAEEREIRQNLEQGIAQATEDAQAQINAHVNTQMTLEKLVASLQENFEASKNETLEQMAKLKESRDQAHRELRLLQGEYSKLQEHALKQMREDGVREDYRVVEMKEQLQAVQAVQDSTEDKLRSEIMFLKDRVMAEQFAKENMEETLQMELESTKEDLARVTTDLEKQKKDQVDGVTQDTNEAIKTVQAKSKEVIVQLQTQLDDAIEEKNNIDAECQQLRNQLQAMQEQLNNSETVQRDFVRLSQSLQMQIAQIQESQSEVRWQHEDDSNQCKKCQKQLIMARDKHHCRHCGKIFCDPCTSNTVESHVAKKPLKVCNECFAMLRKDANTSYFNVHLADEKT